MEKEQIERIKRQLISQIKSKFPEDKKDSAISQIESMNEEQLEQFLIENNLVKDSAGIGTTPPIQPQKTQQCIFCSIADNSIQSYNIDENKDSVAVLEINPISKGHVLIIPKKHISNHEKMPSSIFSLGKKISKKIKTKLKPKEIKLEISSFMNHIVLNVLPIYENETLNSKRKQESPDELENLKKILENKPAEKKKKTIKIKEEKLWLPRRIP